MRGAAVSSCAGNLLWVNRFGVAGVTPVRVLFCRSHGCQKDARVLLSQLLLLQVPFSSVFCTSSPFQQGVCLHLQEAESKKKKHNIITQYRLLVLIFQRSSEKHLISLHCCVKHSDMLLKGAMAV